MFYVIRIGTSDLKDSSARSCCLLRCRAHTQVGKSKFSKDRDKVIFVNNKLIPFQIQNRRY